MAAQGLSEIQRFYENKTVFLTGCTGYIGKLLLEKMLRSLPIKHVYVLVRVKKGKSPTERFQELFDCIIYEGLKRSKFNFMEKITMIEGDLLKPNLGISEENRELLMKEVQCVMHLAATVRFDQKIKFATYINVRATRDLLILAHKMPKLKSFVHVSTAYSNCPRPEVDEVIYESRIDSDDLIRASEALPEDVLEASKNVLFEDWPNSYVFTKQVAEDAVRKYGSDLPLVIVRPSIVIATAEEPIRGFIDNIYGPTGIAVGVGIGVLRTYRKERKSIIDVMPSDYIVNSIIAAGWDVGESWTKKKVMNVTVPEQPKVYNIVSGTDNPLESGEMQDIITYYCKQVGSTKCIWHPIDMSTSDPFLYLIFNFLLHTIPNYTIDFILMCLGRKPLLIEGYKKMDKFIAVIGYFICRSWHFHNKNMINLLRKMSFEDRQLFNFDIAALNWHEYLAFYARGARVYILKEPLDNIEEAKRYNAKLKYAHMTLLMVLSALGYFVLKFFFKLIIGF